MQTDDTPLVAPLLLRKREVASLLGLGQTTVEALIARGEIPSVKIGTARRVKHRDLVEWVERQVPE